MWMLTQDEDDLLWTRRVEAGYPSSFDVTPERLEACLARGRRLRAEALAQFGQRIGRAVRAWLRGSQPSAEVVGANSDPAFAAPPYLPLAPTTPIRPSGGRPRDDAEPPIERHVRFGHRPAVAGISDSETEGAQRHAA